MTTDTKPVAESEPTQRPPQFGIWQMLVIVACCGIVLTGWRKNLELLHAVEGVIFAAVIAGIAAILLLLFRNWMKPWAEATVALLIATVLFAAVAPEPRRYGGARREQCGHNLRWIGVALHSYHDVYHSFPPAYVADEKGRPMHSWRVLLLPFLEQQPLYDQYRFDEPWDGPNNRRLHQQLVHVYQCPGGPREPARRDDTQTSYLVVVGPRTAFPEDKCVALSDITDDHGNTILVVEVANSGIHWMEPRDLHVTQMDPQVNPSRGQGISSKHRGGANVVMVDGTVEFLDAKLLTADQIEAMLTIAGGEKVKTP
ncbi:MAG TPA: DUF1559 domain-containing protein [Pirellulaceae bacterium]|nr:DUF1559 domain-containing protein [Pirellulaceae bacterium]